MTYEIVITQFIAGLYSACFLFLISIGLSLLFGAGDFFNFSHGVFFMFGGLIVYTCFKVLGFSFPLALFCAVLIVSIVSFGIYFILIKQLTVYKTDFSVQLLITIGLLYIFSDVVRLIWGSNFYLLDNFELSNSSIVFMGTTLSLYQFVIIIVTIIIGGFLVWFMNNSRFGRLVRASTNNSKMLANLGYDPVVVIRNLFILGAAFAALGGGLYIPLLTISSSSGHEIIVTAILVTILGGRGNIVGTAVAAIIISQFIAFSNLIYPEISHLIPFLLTLIVLIIRPQGIFSPTVSNKNNERV